VKRLNETQIATLKLPEMREKLMIEAVDPMPMSPEQFGQFIKDENRRWTALAKARNIQLEE
jgi:tripartite-type tricarboxylate transporter receptor subunit TctC